MLIPARHHPELVPGFKLQHSTPPSGDRARRLLSPSRQCVAGEFCGAVVVISHDVYFLERAVTEFWSLRDTTVTSFSSLEVAKRHAKVRRAEIS